MRIVRYEKNKSDSKRWLLLALGIIIGLIILVIKLRREIKRLRRSIERLEFLK